jgi:hypothetical protein
MKNLIIVIIFTIIFGGCTINFGPTQPEKEIKTEVTETKKEVTETKKETHKPWPHVEKEYWYAKYFLSMAMNTDVQRMLSPRQVFEVVKCTVDGFEKDYEYERFVREIGANLRLPPHLSKYIYDISFECSLEVKRKAAEEQSKKPLTLKDSV